MSRSERIALRSARQQPTGAAAQFEHYQDQESFQTYVRREIASRVAAQQGISVQFTDPEMQGAMRLLQRLANPRQRQQERGGR